MVEKTLVIIKPDALQRKLVGVIINLLEYIPDIKIVNIKTKTLKKDDVIKHYSHVKSIACFSEMIDFMTKSQVALIILEGDDAVGNVRVIQRGIRNEFGLGDSGKSYRNLLHASDSARNAQIEINRFMKYWR